MCNLTKIYPSRGVVAFSGFRREDLLRREGKFRGGDPVGAMGSMMSMKTDLREKTKLRKYLVM